MCVLLYRAGFADALGQYCTGRPGRDLAIPALALPGGRYFLTVLQDLDTYGGGPSYVHENISDRYSLRAEATLPAPDREVEPNDLVASATPLSFGRPLSATLAWARDEDVFCAPSLEAGSLRWTVRAGFRESGVIEATPIHDGEEGAPVRVHPEPRGRPTRVDVPSPWQSAPLAGGGGGQRCLRLRLTTDPWAGDRWSAAPSGGSEPYVVEVDALP